MKANQNLSQDVLSRLQNSDVISMRDFSRDEILGILDATQKMKQFPNSMLLQGKILASCFFEPSTRTRLSFEAAMQRLGGNVIGFAEAKSTSATKRESLHDTIKVVGQYSDVIVVRHPLDGAARLAAESTDKPVINAGDGSNQHPTQTLLDLFSIRECQNRLDGLHLAFVGDLKYGRAVHSLVQACSLFNARMYFVAHPGFDLPKPMYDELKKRSIMFSLHPSLKDIMPKLDIVYLTRIQEERMAPEIYQDAKEGYSFNSSTLDDAKPTMRILHPLPRVNEQLDPQIDDTPHAYYFEQSQNGLFLRQALLSIILGKQL
jgi:aspartate carbamoyltransferase catalytic subunit